MFSHKAREKPLMSDPIPKKSYDVRSPNKPSESRERLLTSTSGIVRTTDSASPRLKKFNILKGRSQE
jgi:hypothetical protein